MSEFDDAIATVRQPDGTRTAQLSNEWAIGEAVNGGALMALTAGALAADVEAVGGHTDVLAFSGHFLRASAPGPVRITTELLRSGRTVTNGAVSLSQDGRERLRALVTFGDLADRSEPVLRSLPAPAIPALDDCIPSTAAPREDIEKVPLMSRLDLRLEPDSAMWALGQPSQRGELNAWVRFADQRPIDALSLLFFLDALPPVAFDLGLMGWAPTLEFSAHLRAIPADGWLQVRLTTQTVAGGLLEEDAAIWDQSGRLVAQSRQLAGVRMPQDGPASE